MKERRLDICNTDSTKQLLPFVKTVHGLEFDEKPDYQYLRFLLVKVLLD